MYEHNAFVTLTYSEKYLPEKGKLEHGALAQFMRDLREKQIQNQNPFEGVRSFGCGEYGEHHSRPHYHICLFNCNFTDKELHTKNRDMPLYTSQILSEIWPWGHATIGELTFESAAYVARYVTKKLSGPKKKEYEKYDKKTGECWTMPEEKALAISRMPGLGRPWWEKHGQYTRDHDRVIVNGIKMKVPKYYDKLNEKYYPEQYTEIKKRRLKSGKEQAKKLKEEDDNNYKLWNQRKIDETHEELHFSSMPKIRIEVMEEVQKLKAINLRRGYENGKT